MKGRRAFLKSVIGALFAAPAASAAMGMAPVGVGGPLATRHGAYFLVDGWVLTAADLATLGIAEPGRRITGNTFTGTLAG